MINEETAVLYDNENDNEDCLRGVCRRLIAHSSLLTAHCSQLIAHSSSLTAHKLYTLHSKH